MIKLWQQWENGVFLQLGELQAPLRGIVSCLSLPPACWKYIALLLPGLNERPSEQNGTLVQGFLPRVRVGMASFSAVDSLAALQCLRCSLGSSESPALFL